MKFADKVYGLCKKIPAGKVSTYGEIAKALKSSPRAVGQALRCNPNAPIVPCHRVVKTDGNLGGFNGEIFGKQIKLKIKRLNAENVFVEKGKIKNFEKIKHSF